MHIRFAKIEDCSYFFKCISRLEETAFPYEEFQKIFESNVQKPHWIYLLAEEKGKPMGILTCSLLELLHHCKVVAEIQELYVEEDSRNQKVGARLIEMLEKILADKHIFQLEVSTNKRRKRAHNFYLQNGFENSHLKLTKSLSIL